MFKLEILCPYHGKVEALTLPDSYENFKGEVRCGSSSKSAIIRIEVVRKNIVSVERVSSPAKVI